MLLLGLLDVGALKFWECSGSEASYIGFIFINKICLDLGFILAFNCGNCLSKTI